MNINLLAAVNLLFKFTAAILNILVIIFTAGFMIYFL